MEGNVWQFIVRAVAFLSNPSSSLTVAQKLENPISLAGAQENDAASSSTSKTIQEKQSLLRVKRNPNLTTKDAIFGDMDFNGKRIGYTMERSAVAIPEGTYPGYKRYSQHFEMTVLGIDVPMRTDIECHPANLPSQLLGCIAVGESIDNDALDNSRRAFDDMMLIVPQEFTVEICSVVVS